MDKRHPAFQRRHVGDQGKILCLLHAAGAEQGAAGLAHGHHVRVIAKNRQGVGGDGARRDVQHEGGKLTRQLIQRRDHQQQPLRRGKGGGERPGLQRAVDGSNRPGFRLHFDHARDISPDVFQPVTGPGIGLFSHRRAGCNGIDGDHFTGAKRDGRDCAIPVNSLHMTPLHCAKKERPVTHRQVL
ncbi:hypothetical protein D3C76_1318800 [compost metagenome]